MKRLPCRRLTPRWWQVTPVTGTSFGGASSKRRAKKKTPSANMNGCWHGVRSTRSCSGVTLKKRWKTCASRNPDHRAGCHTHWMGHDAVVSALPTALCCVGFPFGGGLHSLKEFSHHSGGVMVAAVRIEALDSRPADAAGTHQFVTGFV